MKKSFSSREAISYSWKHVTSSQNIWFYIGFAVLLSIYHLVTGYVSNLSILMYIVVTLLAFYVGLVAVKVGMRGVAGKSQKFSKILKGVSLNNTLDYFFASILVGLSFVGIIGVAVLLAFVSGALGTFLMGAPSPISIVLLIIAFITVIFLSVRWQFSSYVILDKGLGAIKSMKKSFNLTSGVFWKLLGFLALLGLINLAGVLALVVGAFITGPMTLVAMAHAYKQLTGGGSNEQTPQSSN
jgi:hypothetical protein